jgi:ferredoxin-NADP reductase
MKFETKVDEVIQRTHDVKSFRFHRPPFFDYKPGQFMFVKIRIGKEEAQKPFSISSSPTEKGFMEFTKKLTDHRFSSALKALKAGDWMGIDGPYGKFTFEGEHEKIAMLSGGVGITPLRSICRYCTDALLDVEITLLYGNRTERDIVFKKEFEEMQKQNKKLKIVFTVDEASEGWNGHTGMINPEMIKETIPDYGERVFYICGPPGMVKAMEGLLHNIGILKANIKEENFAGY